MLSDSDEIIKPLPSPDSIKLSADIAPQFSRIDDQYISRLSVVEELIDRGALEIEKRGIEEQLAHVLTDEELLAWARENYPYQNVDTVALQARLDEIDALLEVE